MTSTRYQKFSAALAQLAQACELFEKYRTTELSNSLRDSMIKRFEFSYELLWKCFKDYLVEQFGAVARSPREAFQEAFEKNLIAAPEHNLLLNMIDDRNMTSHTYDEKTAQEVAAAIPDHLGTMQSIAYRVFGQR